MNDLTTPISDSAQVFEDSRQRSILPEPTTQEEAHSAVRTLLVLVDQGCKEFERKVARRVGDIASNELMRIGFSAIQDRFDELIKEGESKGWLPLTAYRHFMEAYHEADAAITCYMAVRICEVFAQISGNIELRKHGLVLTTGWLSGSRANHDPKRLLAREKQGDVDDAFLLELLSAVTVSEPWTLDKKDFRALNSDAQGTPRRLVAQFYITDADRIRRLRESSKLQLQEELEARQEATHEEFAEVDIREWARNLIAKSPLNSQEKRLATLFQETFDWDVTKAVIMKEGGWSDDHFRQIKSGVLRKVWKERST